MTYASMLTLLFCTLVGCQDLAGRWGDKGRRKVLFRSDIVRLGVIAGSPLLDRNSDKRADGVLTEIYAYTADREEPVGIDGPLVVYLVKRVDGSDNQATDKVLKTWTLTSDQVARSVRGDRFGFTCHWMELYWDDVEVNGPDIYLRSEFVRPDERVVKSRPLSIHVPSRVSPSSKESR